MNHSLGTEMTILRARRLTTFSVASDGSSIAIGVADEEGKAGALMLPADCLKELMMTLPEMMRRALRQQHGDPSLRLVYSTAGWEVERSKLPGTFIVTFRTPDGFHVSFPNGDRSLRDGGCCAQLRTRARSTAVKAAQRTLKPHAISFSSPALLVTERKNMLSNKAKRLLVVAAAAAVSIVTSLVAYADGNDPPRKTNINLAVAANFYGIPPSNSAITDIINAFESDNPTYTVTVVDNGATATLESHIINGNAFS